MCIVQARYLFIYLFLIFERVSFFFFLFRANIDKDYFEKPQLVKQLQLDDSNDYCWFYKSNNSDYWWKYDKNSSDEIENAFNIFKSDSNKFQLKILIAGNVYIIDFKQNLQIRNDNRGLRRKIKRDKVKIDKLAGVAGLKLPSSAVDELEKNFKNFNIKK